MADSHPKAPSSLRVDWKLLFCWGRGSRLKGDWRLQPSGHQQGSKESWGALCLWVADSSQPRPGLDVLRTLDSAIIVFTRFPVSGWRKASGKELFAEISDCEQNSFWRSTSLCSELQGWTEPFSFFSPFSPHVKAAKETNTIRRQRSQFFPWLRDHFSLDASKWAYAREGYSKDELVAGHRRWFSSRMHAKSKGYFKKQTIYSKNKILGLFFQ